MPSTIYVSPSGNDSTGNGSIGTPYRLPSRACVGSAPIAASGDTVSIAAGTYTQGSTSIIPAAGVILQGAGMDQSLITTSCFNNGGIFPGNGCVLNDFKISDSTGGASFAYPVGAGSIGTANANFTASRVWIVGGTDCIFGVKSATLNDCVLQSNWDVFAGGQEAASDSLTLNHCAIISIGNYAHVGGNAPDSHGLSQYSGNITMTGGSLMIGNGTSDSVAVDTSTLGQVFTLNGVSIHAFGDAAAGADIWDIRIAGESQVRLQNCSYDPTKVKILSGDDLDPGVDPGTLVVSGGGPGGGRMGIGI